MRLEAFTIATITKYVNVTLCPICAPCCKLLRRGIVLAAIFQNFRFFPAAVILF